MPSLRKRVSTYLRQLSFHNEPRDRKNNVNENAFVTKYLQGQTALRDGLPIIYGKNPTDLPVYELAQYESGPDSVVACYTGPSGGLTTVRRTEKHLSVADDDIDFIDNPEEEEEVSATIPTATAKKSPNRISGQPIDNTTMVIRVAGNEYCVTNKSKRHSKSHSLGSISDCGGGPIEVERTRIDRRFYECDENSNKERAQPLRTDETDDVATGDDAKTDKDKRARTTTTTTNPTTNNVPSKRTDVAKRQNYPLAKSQSEGNHPHRNRKRGKIVQAQRSRDRRDDVSSDNHPSSVLSPDDTALPSEWSRKSDLCYGLSGSLYDTNQVTKQKNGDPIADCFGVISRNDSAILAVADGVNWGEKASIAAKSAIHAALHYLNKTIFNDTKPFERLTNNKTDDVSISSDTLSLEGNANLIRNTREVFVCLLRAFNCAHDLILENKGMLTTLTVAIVLPLKAKPSNRAENGVKLTRPEPHYVCCVCNVGDTLAYVYSPKHGIRELTKGSHDVTSNRDMRDALGALGPVDGINPELSNLTLSITTLHRGDIVMVASDGLTDNFDPNVCRFTVNSTVPVGNKPRTNKKPPSNDVPPPNPPATTSNSGTETSVAAATAPSAQKPPIKPPRKHKNRSSVSSGSQSERSASSVEKETSDASKRPPQQQPPPPAVIENKASSLRKLTNHQQQHHKTMVAPATAQQQQRQRHQGYQFLLKSKTSIDLRPPDRSAKSAAAIVARNSDGIPYVTPIQRYELQLLLMEDVLRNGISGRDAPVAHARHLCENLVNFTTSITAAKRRTLEDPDMYFDNRQGVSVEITNQQKKARRKRALDKAQALPGKLDHVTVVAWNVGNVAAA